MACRSMYCYAWDIAEVGVDQVAVDLSARHINTITLAAAYHAGKFLRPHGQNGKVYFPQDGTAYFNPEMGAYGSLKPERNPLLAQDDILAQCCALPDMQTNAWLVLLHNSRLGQLHPTSCVANAFGDRYIYSLCPSAPEVQEYALALCKDLTDHYPVCGITLETPGFLPFYHDYHHEFGMVKPNVWLDNLLGLCFCDHCIAGAQEVDINAGALKLRVRNLISSYLDSDMDYSPDMASAFWQSELVLDPDLHAYLNWRCAVVEGLVKSIRQVVRKDATISVIPSVARPSSGAWYEGSDLNALKNAADYLEICFYEPEVHRIRADLFDVTSRCGGTDKLRGILRPGYPDMDSQEKLINAVATLNKNGISDIAFYNYGHMRKTSLDWVARALKAEGLTQ